MQYNYYYLYQAFCVDTTNSFHLPWLWFHLLSIDTVSKIFDEFFDTLQAVCHGCDYYVTIECAQTICAPLLQNAQYATQVRKFSAHTRNRREKRGLWSDIELFLNMAKVAKKGNMVWYGRNHTIDKRTSKIRVFILPLKCLIWIIIQNIPQFINFK